MYYKYYEIVLSD